MSSRGIFLTVLIALSTGQALAQGPPADVLSLSLEGAGDSLVARVFLDAIQGEVQGVSFAVCHSTGDVVFDEAAVGNAVLAANNGVEADFVSVRAGGSPGQGFITMTCVFDFEGRAGLRAGTHELLVLTYAFRPGGTGGSIRFCSAGEPPVEALVARNGRGTEPETRLGNSSGANRMRMEQHIQGAASLNFCLFEVPIHLTTDRPGLTGFTVVLCYREAPPLTGGLCAVSVAEAIVPFMTPPEGGPLSFAFDFLEEFPGCTVPIFGGPCDPMGFRLSAMFQRPLPRVTDMPILVARFQLFGPVGANLPFEFCAVGKDAFCYPSDGNCSDETDTVTALRFGQQTVLPVTNNASLIVASEQIPGYVLDNLRVADANSVEINVGLVQGSGERRFDVVATFDSTLFQVVPEANVEDHRGSDLSEWLAPISVHVASETRHYENGAFIYSIDLGPCPPEPPPFPSLPLSLLRLRLARKTLSLPGGGVGPVAGGPFPIAFRDFIVDGTAAASNRVTTAVGNWIVPCRDTFSGTPDLSDGSLTMGDARIYFKASSANVAAFEEARVALSMDSGTGGITSLIYTVTHDPEVLAIEKVEDSEALLGKSPQSSTFVMRPDGFTHTIVTGASEPLGPLQDFPLARVAYRPIGRPGQSSEIHIVTEGDLRPIVALPIDGEPVAYIPTVNTDGEVRIQEDPSLLRLHVAAGRAAPGSTAVALVLLDAGAPGVGQLTGSLRHDPALASVDSAYLGQGAMHLGAVLAGIPGIAHTLDPTLDGVRFSAQWSGEGLPRAEGLEVFRIGYRLQGRYGDACRIELTAPAGVGGTLPEGQGGGGGLPQGATPVENLDGGQVILTDPLAESIAPETTPGDLLAVAVTEFGWRWGITEGSTTVRHHGEDGNPFGPDIALPAPPRRIASGGEGWAWASYPGHVAILRFDAVEGNVDVGGEPHGIAVDRERNAWAAVAGATGRLLKLGRDGRILRVVALPFPEPREVTIDEEGALWVAHEGSGALSRVSADGSVVRPEAARIRSTRPAGLTADGRGTLWASDAGDRSLLAFNLAGRETARIALPSEPTDISVDGAGSLWTVLLDPDRLVRIDPASGNIAEVKPAATRHGDRTGLLALRLMVPKEDNDLDLIANLVEVRNGTSPLDSSDPPADRSVPPVEGLEAVVLAVRLGPGGIENKVGVTWRNAQAYTRHEVTLDGQVVVNDLAGDETSAVLEGIPPGPSRVGVTSFLGERASPEASTAIQVGPGTSVRAIGVANIEAVDLAADPEGGRIFVLDARANEVVVLDEDFRTLGRFAVPPPLGDLENVLTGLAFRPPVGGGGGGGLPGSDGSLIVLDGFGGRYQGISTTGVLLDGPFLVPFPGGAFFTKLAFGDGDGGPRVFTVASGPQNDCIIFFRYGGDGPFGEIEHPLAPEPGARLSLGGLAFDASGGTERLWIATGLEGEVLPRVALGVPLGGGGSVAKVFFNLFDDPGGTSQLRGIDVSPTNGEFHALTSDSRLHLLSAFGVAREDGAVPEIGAVGGGGGEGGGGGIALRGAVGPLEGGTTVVIDGANLGQDPEDVKVLFGRREAEVIALERAGALDRLTVLSPPGEAAGPVPIFVFRTRGLDFIEVGFVYCDLPAGTEPDCNGDGIRDECQLPLNDCDSDGTLDACQFELADCNLNGLLDGCDIATGSSLDEDSDGIPDECVKFDRRDPNGDGEGNISDPLHVLGFLFLGEPADMACRKSGDSNDDGDLNVSDPLHLLNFLFSGTAPPPAPSGDCAYDPTQDPLPCEAHAACRK